MELSFVASGTQTRRYTLKLVGLLEDTGPGATPVDPAWVDDALTAAVRVFDAHHVHSADAYFTYHAHETAQHPRRTAGKTATARVTDDLHDDMLLLADTFVIAQLATLISLEASGMASVIDIHLVVERLRGDTLVPPADGIGDVTFVLETGVGVRSMASRR